MSHVRCHMSDVTCWLRTRLVRSYNELQTSNPEPPSAMRRRIRACIDNLINGWGLFFMSDVRCQMLHVTCWLRIRLVKSYSGLQTSNHRTTHRNAASGCGHRTQRSSFPYQQRLSALISQKVKISSTMCCIVPNNAYIFAMSTTWHYHLENRII